MKWRIAVLNKKWRQETANGKRAGGYSLHCIFRHYFGFLLEIWGKWRNSSEQGGLCRLWVSLGWRQSWKTLKRTAEYDYYNITVTCFITNHRTKSALATSLLSCIHDVPDSTLDRFTEYSDYMFSWFASVPLGKRRVSNSIRTRQLLSSSSPIQYSVIVVLFDAIFWDTERAVT
jgi:hypothetical protein